jgi:hypothetical protein
MRTGQRGCHQRLLGQAFIGEPAPHPPGIDPGAARLLAESWRSPASASGRTSRRGMAPATASLTWRGARPGVLTPHAGERNTPRGGGRLLLGSPFGTVSRLEHPERGAAVAHLWHTVTEIDVYQSQRTGRDHAEFRDGGQRERVLIAH